MVSLSNGVARRGNEASVEPTICTVITSVSPKGYVYMVGIQICLFSEVEREQCSWLRHKKVIIPLLDSPEPIYQIYEAEYYI